MLPRIRRTIAVPRSMNHLFRRGQDNSMVRGLNDSACRVPEVKAGHVSETYEARLATRNHWSAVDDAL